MSYITNFGNRSRYKPKHGHSHRGWKNKGSFRSPNTPSYLSFPGTWGQGGSFSYNNQPQPSGQPSSALGMFNRPQGYYSNLENNLPLPQGSQRQFAQPTSISGLITNLLYQSRKDPSNYWGNFFNTSGGQGGTGYGYMGAGSYNPYTGKNSPYNTRGGYGTSGANFGGYGGGTGGMSNNYGNMSQSTVSALRLADAYFAPKRLDLAYQLGDMETDMRRLAVNLGRQVDDPILQAKMYKEAMMQMRTLDLQQNEFAINMVEQRRKEEMQNQQFYENLSMEYEKMQMQNDQFYDQLDQQDSQFSASQGG